MASTGRTWPCILHHCSHNSSADIKAGHLLALLVFNLLTGMLEHCWRTCSTKHLTQRGQIRTHYPQWQQNASRSQWRSPAGLIPCTTDSCQATPWVSGAPSVTALPTSLIPQLVLCTALSGNHMCNKRRCWQTAESSVLTDLAGTMSGCWNSLNCSKCVSGAHAYLQGQAFPLLRPLTCHRIWQARPTCQPA